VPGKLRVHELAKQLGVTSKELLATLKTVAPQMTQDYPYQPHHYLYPYFYLTPQGVYIGPLLPARAAAHAHPAGSVIPYGEIKKHPGILGEKTLP